MKHNNILFSLGISCFSSKYYLKSTLILEVKSLEMNGELDKSFIDSVF